MRTRVAKWGNSLAVRIPRAFVARAGLNEGSAIEIAEKDGALVLRKPRYRLDDLLAGVTDSNRHGESDWGEPRGDEVW